VSAPPTSTGQPRAWTTWAAHTFNISQSGEVGHFEPVNADGDDNFCVRGWRWTGCAADGAGSRA
jgi:hypothetical protein